MAHNVYFYLMTEGIHIILCCLLSIVVSITDHDNLTAYFTLDSDISYLTSLHY